MTASTSSISATMRCCRCAISCCGSMVSAISRCSARATTRCGCGSIRTGSRPSASRRGKGWGGGRRGPHTNPPRRAPRIAARPFQPNLTFTGRLRDTRQFEDIVVKAGADGRTVRLRDVARIELGALAYTTNRFLLRKAAVALLVTQRPGSNALATAKNISNAMVKLKADFPRGLDYNIGYNPTEFIAQSVSELIKTIYEAMLLVVIVVLVFLQGWRPAIIPIVAIPVSLIGTFAVMAALGFSINNL